MYYSRSLFFIVAILVLCVCKNPTDLPNNQDVNGKDTSTTVVHDTANSHIPDTNIVEVPDTTKDTIKIDTLSDLIDTCGPLKACRVNTGNYQNFLMSKRFTLIGFYKSSSAQCRTLGNVIDSLCTILSPIMDVGGNDMDRDTLSKHYNISTSGVSGRDTIILIDSVWYLGKTDNSSYVFILFNDGKEVARSNVSGNEPTLYNNLLFFILMSLGTIEIPNTGLDPSGPQMAATITRDNYHESVESKLLSFVAFYRRSSPQSAGIIQMFDRLKMVFGDTVIVGVNNLDSDTLGKRFKISDVPIFATLIYGQPENLIADYSDEMSLFISSSLNLLNILSNPELQKYTVYITGKGEYLDFNLNLFSLILKNNRVGLALLFDSNDFSSRVMDTTVQAIFTQYKTSVAIGKLDRSGPNFSEIASRYLFDTTVVPQLLFFKHGFEYKEVRKTGVVSFDTIARILDLMLSDQKIFNFTVVTPEIIESAISQCGVTLVEFYNPACPVCIDMGPTVALVADSFHTSACILRANTSEYPEFRKMYGVNSTPTYAFYANSVQYQIFSGGGKSMNLNWFKVMIQEGIDIISTKRP